MLKPKLEKYYAVKPFSIITHCTNSQIVTEKIMQEGLKEYCGRKLEGTVFMHGDLINACESSLTNAFLNNNFIIILAVPSEIGLCSSASFVKLDVVIKIPFLAPCPASAPTNF